jgi:hypothetical protein
MVRIHIDHIGSVADMGKCGAAARFGVSAATGYFQACALTG